MAETRAAARGMSVSRNWEMSRYRSAKSGSRDSLPTAASSMAICCSRRKRMKTERMKLP